MEYKLIALDMDGTLLNDNREISDKNLRAIRRAEEKEIFIIISTGRAVQGIEKYNSILKLSSPVIAYNGAVIFDLQKEKTIFEKCLDADDAKKIIEIGQNYNTTMCIWSKNQLYVNEINDRIEEYKKLSGIDPIRMQDIDILCSQGITKILWYDTKENIAKFNDGFAEYEFKNVSYCKSMSHFLEFFNKEVSKATALEKIGEMYKIKASEMIAVGDGSNDISMIEYAGLGVAMENAEEELKMKAKAITKSNNHDGVADVIYRYLLF